jgi:hypothetical protein
MIYRATSIVLLAVASVGFAQSTVREPIFESTTSGLVTFSGTQKALRVAVALTAPDEAVVGTVIRFIDAKGRVIKRARGEVRERFPLVAELTHHDLGHHSDTLVRVEVVHRLPEVRQRHYPILVTVQPILPSGIGGFVLDWNGGQCGCPTCGPPTHHGRHVDCEPPEPADI